MHAFACIAALSTACTADTRLACSALPRCLCCSGHMSERVAAAKAQQLVSFLAHAHAKHVIHRHGRGEQSRAPKNAAAYEQQRHAQTHRQQPASCI